MNTIKKVFTLSAILILMISSVMTASKVRAASEFTCGTTSLNDNPGWPGTINCETGTDYIRWTFSGLPVMVPIPAGARIGISVPDTMMPPVMESWILDPP
jgi:hypothetical protein